MLSNREGFNLDSVCAAISRVVHYNTMLPLALGLLWAPDLLQQFSFGLEETTMTNKVVSSVAAYLRVPVYVAAGLTTAYAVNSYLTRQTTNNWVEDATYDFAGGREIVLITGGSSGLGAGVARAFRRRSRRTRIVVVDLAEPPAPPQSCEDDKEGEDEDEFLYFYRCDVTDEKAVVDMADRVRSEVGHPTVLFNNAGIGRAGPVMLGGNDNDNNNGSTGTRTGTGAQLLQDAGRVVGTNLVAQILVTRQFLPEMVRRDHGHIVWSSSMSSVIAMPMVATYSATKAGLCALHDALQMELVHFYNAPRVRQTLGIFGFIRTPLISWTPDDGFVIPLLHVDTVSEAIVDGVYSTYGSTIYLPGAARYITALRGGPAWLFQMLRNGVAAGLAKARKADFQASIDCQLGLGEGKQGLKGAATG